jgi:hypothetical protein
MDTPDSPESKMPFEEGTADHRAAHESLAQFVFSVLVLVIVVSGTLNILLLRLWKNSREDVRNFRPQFQAIVDTYSRTEKATVDRAQKALCDFGATNPDYVPILTKYGFKPSASIATPSPSTPKK